MYSDSANSKKTKTDDKPRGTYSDQQSSKKVTRRMTYLFDVTFDDLSKFKEGECPTNTEKNTKWAIKIFESWRSARNKGFQKTSVLLKYCL